jgi:hypothetical protein
MRTGVTKRKETIQRNLQMVVMQLGGPVYLHEVVDESLYPVRKLRSSMFLWLGARYLVYKTAA